MKKRNKKTKPVMKPVICTGCAEVLRDFYNTLGAGMTRLQKPLGDTVWELVNDVKNIDAKLRTLDTVTYGRADLEHRLNDIELFIHGRDENGVNTLVTQDNFDILLRRAISELAAEEKKRREDEKANAAAARAVQSKRQPRRVRAVSRRRRKR